MNYFLQPSELPYELPDFEAVHKALEDGTIIPAFQTAIDDHAAEIAAIADNPDDPTWENTFEALEESGEMLDRVLAIVFNFSGSLATQNIQEIEAKISPVLAAHTSDMLLNEKLWQKIQAVPAAEEGSEEAALQKYWTRRFVRGGANLSAEERQTLREIDSQLAELTTTFGTVLQQATSENAVLLTDAEEVAGLSESEKAYFAAEAEEQGKQGWLIRLGLPSVQPVIESLDNPEARRKVHEASLRRAKGATHETLLKIAQLRARRANLLGYETHADFVAEVETAGSRQAVEGLLSQLTPAAVANAWGEYKRAADKRAVSAKDHESELTGADWPYWAGQLRAEELRVDEAELKKYFPLDSVLEAGAFYAAERLYGIKVTRREDLKGYHPDVKVWEVSEGETGEGIGLLLTDMFARPTKRGGAWMSSFVDQNNLKGQAPVVVNVMNIAKPAEGEQALLTIDEVTTVFHEFGHALHGLLSDVRYPSLSGTSVPRDFVEFPSQINENWALEPEILAHYARHVETGEALPPELVAAVRAQSKWGQGFATTEYLAACWVDLAWHTLSSDDAEKVTDVEEFEANALQQAGVDMEGLIAPRYRSAYFNHIFAGGYSAGYWSYLWAEVLDADGFQAFIDTGAARGEGDDEGTQNSEPLDLGDVRAAGDRFRRMILSRGATIDYEDAFWMFRGQQKSVQPLLRRRGLDGA